MLKHRIMTGIVLAPAVLLAVAFLSANALYFFCGLLVLLGAWEWSRLSGLLTAGPRSVFVLMVGLVFLMLYFWMFDRWFESLKVLVWGWLPALCLVVTFPKSQWFLRSMTFRLLCGLWLLVTFWLSLVVLVTAQEQRYLILGWVLLLVWGADTGAYFAGKYWGRHKLAPKVSPGKTWEGVVGGILTAMAIATLFRLFLGADLFGHLKISWFLLLALTTALVLVSVLGDLFESLFKRYANVKDSGRLFPGHGGILDRIDSLAAACPVYTLAVTSG